MKSSAEDISPVKKKLYIEIESDEVDQKINDAYVQLRKKVKVPGFRPGKVPRNVLEQRFARDVHGDVARDLINESFPKAIEELNAMPLGSPLLETEPLAPGASFKYWATIEVRPEFDLPDYLGVTVEKEKFSVTEEDVSGRIEEIRQANGKLEPVEPERPVQEGDYVVLDYQLFEGDQPVEDLNASDFVLKIGTNELHPQFDEALVGMNKNEKTEISAQFDEGHANPRYAGKSLRFKVTVTDIKEMVLPELNDMFAQSLGSDFNTLEALKQKLREMMQEQEEKRINNEMKQRLLGKIAGGVDFETPEVLVESELNYALENFKQHLVQNGSSLEAIGVTEEQFKTDYRPSSEKRVKEMLVLDEIAKKDSISVDEADLDKAYAEMATSMGLQPDVVRQYHEARGAVDSLKEKVFQEKTLNYIVESASIKEVEKAALEKGKETDKENR